MHPAGAAGSLAVSLLLAGKGHLPTVACCRTHVSVKYELQTGGIQTLES